jgi:uncharacterized protein (DUF427 family)
MMAVERTMNDSDLEKHRAQWRHRGQARPDFAIEPGPGQESVWDYPRPPAVVPDARHVVVRCGDQILADSHNTLRVLETASPPTFYIPPADVNFDLLQPDHGHTFCEWKGQADYFKTEVDGQIIAQVAWCYPEPFEAFEAIRNYLSFYPEKCACFVDDERVQAQGGGYYGGWVTAEIVGPFKGQAGTSGW